MSVFDSHYEKYDTWYDKNRFAYLSELELLKRVLPDEGTGLEIGVGTGRFAGPLKITHGIDPSENMLKAASQRGIDTCLGSGEELPYKDNTFSYVAIIIALCFVSDPLGVLKESRRVLKEGGRIIIGIIDKESFLGKLYQKKESLFYKKANFFSVDQISSLLKEAGFDRLSYYQTLFHPLKEIERVEEPKEGFGEGSFVAVCGFN